MTKLYDTVVCPHCGYEFDPLERVREKVLKIGLEYVRKFKDPVQNRCATIALGKTLKDRVEEYRMYISYLVCPNCRRMFKWKKEG